MENRLKKMILDLQDAGITNEYVNELLIEIENERKIAQKEGAKVGEVLGREEFRNVAALHFKGAKNFNADYLYNWVINLKF